MLTSRDRLLVGLFVLQLTAALVFGVVLVNGLADAGSGGTVAVDSDGEPVDPGEVTAPGDDGVTTPGDTAGVAAPGETTDGGVTAPGETAPDGAGGTGATATGTGGPAVGTREGIRTGVTDTSIKIGALVTQTGAINFKSSAQATRAYVDLINEQGGIHGRKLELLLRDDGLDANRGQAAVQEMLNAGVFAFVGFNAPLTEQSIVPVLMRNKIDLYGSFNAPGTERSYIFSGPYTTFGFLGGRYLAMQGVKKPGIVFISNQNEAADANIVKGYKEGFASQGVELTDDNIHAVDVTKASYDDVVAQLVFNQVDGIATLLETTGMVRLQQSMNRAGYKPKHMASPFGGDPAVLRNPQVGSSFEGTFVISDVEFLDGPSPGVAEYAQQVRRRFGAQADLNWAGQHGWLAAKVFVEALRRAGRDITREHVMASLRTFGNWQNGFTTPMTINAQTEPGAVNICAKIGKVANAKVVQVRDWECHR